MVFLFCLFYNSKLTEPIKWNTPRATQTKLPSHYFDWVSKWFIYETYKYFKFWQKLEITFRASPDIFHDFRIRICAQDTIFSMGKVWRLVKEKQKQILKRLEPMSPLQKMAISQTLIPSVQSPQSLPTPLFLSI